MQDIKICVYTTVALVSYVLLVTVLRPVCLICSIGFKSTSPITGIFSKQTRKLLLISIILTQNMSFDIHLNAQGYIFVLEFFS